MVEHTLWWQTSAQALPVDITYDLPPGTMMFITDQLGGIFLNLGPLIEQGTATIPGNYTNIFNRAFIKMYYNNIGGNPIPGPLFTLVPNEINFGEVAYGQTETLPVMVSNMGYLDSLYIYNVVSSNPSFTFEPNSFPIIIAPGHSELFNISYTGITGRTHHDSLLFMHNAPGSPTKLNVIAQTYDPNPNCEAQIMNEVIISDGVDPTPRILKFGLDSTGTDGIDPQLGEFGPLPPFPPPQAFEAQLFLPENNFSGTLSAYCDFRYGVTPFTGQKEWRLSYQTSYGNQITITWNFPSYMNGILQDIINGTYINAPMVDSGSYTVQDPYVFNRLRMLINFDIETPVELTSFNATLLDYNVRLDWSTATETNNSGFEIERVSSMTTPGQGWEKIGFVPGFGTTTEPMFYSFSDENVITGIYKYRLKQIDFDGSFEYSNEIEVDADFTPREFVLYQNYPNPFNPNTTIKFTIPNVETHRDASLQMVILKVYDMLGKEVATLVNEEKQPGVYEVEFHSEWLSSGIYFYQLKTGSFSSIKKMVLLK